MSNIQIWHNPRCSKSRNGLNILEENGIEVEVVKYLDTPHSQEEITNLLKMLGMNARELMRTKESIYKELDLKNENDEGKLIQAMVENPKLIERPIVIKEGKAVIGRPIENIMELVKGDTHPKSN
ncbi:MAG TPA: arsenate reductase (glutaredoxin) [Campylobacterales bacterium]|nr:arsenate reductase (glutaredoxin) [Campylobacterales bacterium]